MLSKISSCVLEETTGLISLVGLADSTQLRVWSYIIDWAPVSWKSTRFNRINSWQWRHTSKRNLNEGLLSKVRNNIETFIDINIEIYSHIYKITVSKYLSTLPHIGSWTAYDSIKKLRMPFPVELNSKTSQDTNDHIEKEMEIAWPIQEFILNNHSVTI